MNHLKLHKRSIARIAAVQSLYQMALINSDHQHTINDFLQHFEKDLMKVTASSQLDRTFFSGIVQGVFEFRTNIDELIQNALPHDWAFNRLDLVLLSILRAATFELWKHPETDYAVILNEYLNVTHAFYDSKEPGFVNGILHAISTHLRPKIS